MRTLAWIACLALACALAPAPAFSKEAPDSASAETSTTVVERGPLGGTIESKGVVVPAKYARVEIEFEAYRGELEIVECAPEGRVVAGQTLVRFDDEPYRRQVAAAERDLALKRIGFERAERTHGLAEAADALRRDEALRAKRLADEALERYVAVERKLDEQDAAYRVQGRRIQIQNMREELAQLEKMYTEDDLTEETEEIVLKRNRRNMERMLESFERFMVRDEYSRKVGPEREHEKLRLAMRKATTALEGLQATMPLDRKKAELELEKARVSLEEAEEQLADLQADAAGFVLKAPMAGMAVRGSFADGAWTGLGRDEAYEAGETMKAGQVPFTVVDESVMRVHTSVKEEDLGDVRVGGTASVRTALTGDDALEAEVGAVARYGMKGAYEVVLRMKAADDRLRTGLGAEVVLTRHGAVEVLSVPKAAVQKHGKGHRVFGADGAPIDVEVGRTVGDRVEIVSGLAAGQRVCAAPPSEDDAAAEGGDAK